MITLSYGYKKPVTGDGGSTFFPALEDNITQLNSHSHNGTDSALITIASVSPTTQAISSASWVSSGALYRQLVTLPGSLQYDNVVVSFRDASSGHYYDLTVEKASATTYYVYINDNTLNLTAYYGA